MSETPRTSEEWRRIQRLPDGRYSSQVTDEDLAHGMCNFAKQLERELAEATKQRDEWFEVFAKNLKKKGVLSDQLIETRQQRDTLAEALEESNLQLQYLNEKYPTGTTSVIITRNEQALDVVKGEPK